MISMHDDPVLWPFSEVVFVITSSPPEEVGKWMPCRCKSDSVTEGLRYADRPLEACELPAGQHADCL